MSLTDRWDLPEPDRGETDSLHDRASIDGTSSVGRPRAFDTILYGGLVVGILDGLFALVFYGLILGATPMRIFQSVASVS